MKSRITFGFNTLLLIGSIFLFNSISVKAEECYLVNNNDICITEEHYNNLINLGFTDFEIRNMPEEEYRSNAELEGHVVSTVTNYYKVTYNHTNDQVISNNQLITEDEYNSLITNSNFMIRNQVGTRSYDGYVETLGKKMTTKIVELNNGKFRYKNTLVWKNIPVTRSYDIISIGMEDDLVHYDGTRVFYQTYCYSVSDCTSNTACSYLNQSTGVGASFKLPEGTLTYIQSYLYYDVVKQPDAGTVTELYAYGDYAHATSEVTESQAANSYNVGTGILLSTVVSGYYDSMSSAVANWTGTW